MSEKLRAQHLSRKAILYVRQSSAYQVNHNLESQKLQYAMQERLRQLGWGEIEVVDEDLGRSAAGTSRVQGLSGWYRKYAWAKWVRSRRGRCPGLHGTAGSGSSWWKSAA